MNPEKIANLLSQIQDVAAGIAEYANQLDPEGGFDAEQTFHGSTEEELEHVINHLSTAFNALGEIL